MDLSDLKLRIIATRTRRAALAQTIAAASASLRAAQRRLYWSQMPVLRLLLRGSTAARAQAVQAAQDAAGAARAELVRCVVDVDSPLNDEARAAREALLRSFTALNASAAIWCVVAAVPTDRVKHRTRAIAVLTREPVEFDLAGSAVIAPGALALHLPNADAPAIAIYPGFALLGDEAGEFDLIGLGDLRIEYADSDFIEQETVPPDAEIIGHTWQKANTDGSLDNRFRDNREVPLLRYGHLEISGPAGLLAVYQVSHWQAARAFAHAMADYQWAMAGNARAGRGS